MTTLEQASSGPDCLAIDIGGTKLAAARIDRSGTVVATDRTPTPITDDAEVLFGSLCAMIDPILASGNLGVVGTGCGGPMRAGGVTVSPLNIPGWRDFPLLGRLEAHTGLPVVVDNDAKAYALGEGWLGAAAGHDNYLAMVVSTGVGAGLIVDGHLLNGADGNAGHLGHIVVEQDGRTCVCGAMGCLEAEASGTSIALITGKPAREASVAVRERTGVMVGRGVAHAAILLDLDLAVVAGSVALGFGDAFIDAAQAEIDRLVQISYARDVKIVRSTLEHGPLLGAAALGWRHLDALGSS